MASYLNTPEICSRHQWLGYLRISVVDYPISQANPSAIIPPSTTAIRSGRAVAVAAFNVESEVPADAAGVVASFCATYSREIPMIDAKKPKSYICNVRHSDSDIIVVLVSHVLLILSGMSATQQSPHGGAPSICRTVLDISLVSNQNFDPLLHISEPVLVLVTSCMVNHDYEYPQPSPLLLPCHNITILPVCL